MQRKWILKWWLSISEVLGTMFKMVSGFIHSIFAEDWKFMQSWIITWRWLERRSKVARQLDRDLSFAERSSTCPKSAGINDLSFSVTDLSPVVVVVGQGAGHVSCRRYYWRGVKDFGVVWLTSLWRGGLQREDVVTLSPWSSLGEDVVIESFLVLWWWWCVYKHLRREMVFLREDAVMRSLCFVNSSVEGSFIPVFASGEFCTLLRWTQRVLWKHTCILVISNICWLKSEKWTWNKTVILLSCVQLLWLLIRRHLLETDVWLSTGGVRDAICLLLYKVHDLWTRAVSE